MSRYLVTSRCECQAQLSAELDQQRHVLAGYASRMGVRESAPAHSIHAGEERFDIAWLCNFCSRNTLRSFYGGALRKLSEPAASSPGSNASTEQSPG